MRPPPPFYALGDHVAIELSGARAAFTTRRGGHSQGPYASLNLGRWTDDDPVAVQRNRDTLEAELGGVLTFVRQVHGARVREVSAESAQADDDVVEADGQVTRTRGVALAALAADCLPIAVAGGGAVAMLHAGWPGLRDGVVDAGVAAVQGLGAGGSLSAAIGPGAGPCCYEVGDELREAFSAYPPEIHRGRCLDLKAIATHQLRRAGVAEIHDIGVCTICSDSALLFSHRRDRGVTGRQAGVAWLT